MAKKIEIELLILELTRRCNATCAHCLRGEAQNIDITREIIDNLFKNNDHEITRINKLFFTGGEPLLNKEMMIYILNYIINNNINVGRISFVTNGLIYDQEVIDLLSKMHLNTEIVIECRMDQFHPSIPKENLKLYQELPHFNYIEKHLTKSEIINIGRAKENNLGDEVWAKREINKFYASNRNVTISSYGEVLNLNVVYVTADGRFTNLKGNASWDMIDEICHKNILNQSLFEQSELLDLFLIYIRLLISTNEYEILEEMFNHEFILDVKQAQKDETLDIFVSSLQYDGWKYLVSDKNFKRELINGE